MNLYLLTGIILLLVVFAVWQIRLENKRFRVTEYTVESEKIKKDMTLAVMADLHNYKYGEDNKKLFDALERIHPDAVISAGDMVEGSENATGTADTIRFLAQVADRYPFFYGMGNHECKLKYYPEKYKRVTREFRTALGQTSLALLDNETKAAGEWNTYITGLNLERQYFRKVKLNPVSIEHIRELVGEPHTDGFQILIAHNPDQFEAYAGWGADLVLSGHVHGGMIAVPGIGGVISPQLTLFPKYDGGLFCKGRTTMILSRGLGNHTVHVRIFNRAELVIVRVKKKQNTSSLEKNVKC